MTSAIKAMKQGAVDFLMKPFDDRELLDSIVAALRKEIQWRQERKKRDAMAVKLAVLRRQITEQ